MDLRHACQATVIANPAGSHCCLHLNVFTQMRSLKHVHSNPCASQACRRFSSKARWLSSVLESLLGTPWQQDTALSTLAEALSCTNNLCFTFSKHCTCCSHSEGDTARVVKLLHESAPSLPGYARKAVIDLVQSKPQFYPMPSWTHLSQLHGPKVLLQI